MRCLNAMSQSRASRLTLLSGWIKSQLNTRGSMAKPDQAVHVLLTASPAVPTLAVAFASALLAVVIAVPRRSQSAAGQAPVESLKAMEAAGVKMAFEVVSVKPDKTNGRAHSIVPLGPGTFPPTGGLFSATGYPLVTYLGWA
jgi:hypothetical protein